MRYLCLAATAMTTALCASVVLSGCDGDDDSGTMASSKDLVTVKVLLDSIVCNNDADATIKEINSSTYKIMCGKDSVGYASTGEYSACNVDVHDDELGADLICDKKIVGEVNFKQEKSSSSKKAASSSSVKPESSSSEEAESSSSDKVAQSSSSKKVDSSSSAKNDKSSSSEGKDDGKSSSSKKVDSSSSAKNDKSSSSEGKDDGKSSSSKKVDSSSSAKNDKSSSSEGKDGGKSSSSKKDDKSSSSATCELLELPEPIAYASEYVDCSAEYDTLEGAEYWNVNVASVSADTARMLWSIGGQGFTVNSGFTKYTGSTYMASGSKVTKDGYNYSVQLSLTVKDDKRYSGNIEFTRKSATCAKIVAAFPNDFVCVKGVATAVADVEYCGMNRSEAYNKTTHFCLDDTSVEPLCGSKSYGVEEFCDNGSVVSFSTCGNTKFDPRKKFCDTRDNQIYGYVKIGEQTWMSENLNFFEQENANNYISKEALTHCAREDCNTYGRLYSWPTAMDMDAMTYLYSKAAIADTVDHQGVCPDGWHIPRMSEFNKLKNAVTDAKGNAVAHLCAEGSLNNSTTCDNSSGFSALPTGVVYSMEFIKEDALSAFWLTNNAYTVKSGSNSETKSVFVSDFYFELPFNVLGVEENTASGMSEQSVRCVKNGK